VAVLFLDHKLMINYPDEIKLLKDRINITETIDLDLGIIKVIFEDERFKENEFVLARLKKVCKRNRIELTTNEILRT